MFTIIWKNKKLILYLDESLKILFNQINTKRKKTGLVQIIKYINKNIYIKLILC